MDTAAAQTPARARTGLSLWDRFRRNVGWYSLVTLLSVLFMGPFVWALSSSLKTPAELYLFPPTLFPKSFQIANYFRLLNELPFPLFTRNANALSLNAAGAAAMAEAAQMEMAACSLTQKRAWYR